MKSYKTISLTAPVTDIHLVATTSILEVEQRQRMAEQAAYERGRRDGEKSLSEQLLAQRAEILELHQGVLNSLQNAVPQLIRETEKGLIELALEAAQKLVADTPIKPKLMEAVVREAIAQVEGSTEITVHLHPEDLALLGRHTSAIEKAFPQAGPIHFSSSSEVTRGGCIVQTSFGLLDARRETKIEQLRKSLAA